MDSRAQNYALPLGYEVLTGLEVGHYEEFAHIACPGFAKCGPSESILAVRRKADPLQEGHTVWVGVRVAVSEVDLVLIMLEFYAKTERVKLLSSWQDTLFAS